MFYRILRVSVVVGLFMVCLAVPQHTTYAAACVSNATGDWSDTGTWTSCGGGTPTTTDSVTIVSPHTVTLNTNATTTGVTLDAGGTLTENLGGWRLAVSGGWTNLGTLTAGSSTVVFTGSQTITGTSTFNNLVFNSANSTNRTYVVTSTTTLIVTGTTTIDNSSTGNLIISTGVIEAQGNVVVDATNISSNTTGTLSMRGSSDQILTVSGATNTSGQFLPFVINKSGGTLYLVGTIRTGENWTYTAGTLDSSNSNVVFGETLTISGSHTLTTVRLDPNDIFSAITITTGSILTVTGTTTIDNSSTGSISINTGILNPQGSIVIDNLSMGSSVSGGFVIDGGQNQTLTILNGSTTAGSFASTTINKSGGTLTVNGIVTARSNFTQLSASSTVDWTTNGATLNFYLDNTPKTFTPGTVWYHDLSFNKQATTSSSGIVTFNSPLYIAGSLSNNFSITTGSNAVIFVGTGTSTLSSGGTSDTRDFQTLTISKTGNGVVQLASTTVDVDGTLAVESGTLDLSGQSITTTATCTVAGGATLQLTGNESVSCTPSFSINATAWYGTTTTVTYPIQNWTYQNLTIDSLGSTYTDSTPRTVNGTTTVLNGTFSVASTTALTLTNVALTGGTFVAPTSTLTVNGNWQKNDANTFTHSSGTVAFSGTTNTITGTTTFGNLSKIVSASSTLFFGANETQTIQGTTTLTGTLGNILTLRSTLPGTQWKFDPRGVRSILYVTTHDSNNINGTVINTSGAVTYDDNNTNWGTGGDVTPPVISAIATSTVTTNAITVSWNTDESADGTVQYGTTISYGSTTGTTTVSTGHSFRLTNLTASTTYHFRVISTDPSSNTSTSSDYTFITNAIDPVFIPSRLSGVAPLSVFFDAASTTAGATTNPFHELDYAWNFDDASSGNWTYGALQTSKNTALGPEAAHLFETAGTYTVSMSVYDGTTTVSTSTTITVTDPDIVFSTTDTICFYNSTVGTGCPTGAVEVATSSFDGAINSYVATGKRLLFKRGDSFTAEAGAIIDAEGPGTVGAYGSGAKPHVTLVSVASFPTILEIYKSDAPYASDWRIMDIQLDGDSTDGSIAITSAKSDQITLVRVDIYDAHAGISFNHASAQTRPVFEDIALHGVTVQRTFGSGGNGVWMYSKRFRMLDSYIHDTTLGEHGFRSQYLGKAVIGNNTLSLAGDTNGGGKLVLTVRAPTWTGTGTISPGTYTEYVVISGNKFVGSDTSGAIVSIMPQNGNEDERHQYTLTERNWFVAGATTTQAFYINSGLNDVLRNNIFDFRTSRGASPVSFASNDGATPSTTLVSVYNNTMWKPDTPAPEILGFAGMYYGVGSTDMIARNNLVYAPYVNEANPVNTISSLIGSELTESHNTPSAYIKTVNPFATTSPTTLDDFVITGSSYAIGTGTPVLGVFRDFYGNLRTGAMDIGAFMEDSSFTDTVAPVITSVASSTGTSTATITWNTNELSDSQVDYGATSSYGSQSSLDSDLATSHSVIITGLTPSMEYHFRARSTDSATNLATSSDYTFHTSVGSDTTPPSVPASLTFSGVTTTALTLAWASSTDDTAVTAYRVYRDNTFIATTTLIIYTDTGLAASTSYSYAVDAFDAAANYSATSTSVSTTTLYTASTSAPTVTTGSASSIDTTTVTLNGTITATGGATVTVRGFAHGTDSTLTTAATTTEAGSFATGAFTYALSGLNCNTTYYARAYAVNTTGTSTGVIDSFTTSACASSGGGGSSSKKKATTTATITTAVPDTTTSNTTEIATLLSLLETLKAQLAILLGTPTSGTSGITLTRNLGLGDTHEDVRTLQVFLNTNGFTIAPEGVGSRGSESTFFGPATRAAVTRYQEAYTSAILTPAGLTKGNGYVGPRTRTHMAGNTTSTVTPPVSPTATTPLTRQLTETDQGEDVRTLQTILKKHTTILTDADITGYYGPKTTEAVKAFQCAQNIVCTGTPATTGWGVVGPRTMGVVQGF